MTGGPPPSTARRASRSVWRETLNDPVTRASLVYALVAIAAVLAAYMSIFTQFARYDDEGTLLVTLKAFVHGDTLYRDVYSPYGPFYYELFGGLFSLSGRAVTNDASRSIVIVVWVGTSFLFGLLGQRLSGRLSLGVASMVVAFSVLYALIAEPMHPQGLCVLLIAGFALLAVYAPGRRPALAGGLAGALAAALVLTKINLGIYLLAAVVLAATLTIEPLSRRPWLRWPVIVAFLAMPLAVVGRDISLEWVRSLLVIEFAAAASIVIASLPNRPRAREERATLVRWLLAAIAGFAIAAAVILIAIIATGPSPADVYDGMIVQAVRVRDALVTAFITPGAAIDWAVLAVAAATLTVLLRASTAARPSLWPGLLRAAAGLAIWFTIARSSPLTLGQSGNQDVLPLLLAWVAAVPPAVAETDHCRFLRVLLPALAVAETLQVYPVSGAQVGIAAVTFVPVGALCLSDALRSLRAWSESAGEQARRRLRAVATVAIVAVATMIGLDHIVLPGVTNALTYRDQEALPFAGAGDIHIPPEQVAEYEGVVGLIERDRCTTLIGYPNVNSLYLWTGIEPPRPAASGAWITALEDGPQRRVLRQLRASPRPCAIRSESLAAGWLAGKPRPQSPLVTAIFNEFEVAAEIGEFEFLRPRPGFAGGRAR